MFNGETIIDDTSFVLKLSPTIFKLWLLLSIYKYFYVRDIYVHKYKYNECVRRSVTNTCLFMIFRLKKYFVLKIVFIWGKLFFIINKFFQYIDYIIIIISFFKNK